MLTAPACSGDDEPDRSRALCERAFPEGTVAAAYPTTVGTVRERTAGPGARPAAAAWPALPDGDPAAWCYVDGTGPHRLVAAVAAGQTVVFGRGTFEPDPDGPRIP